MNKVSILILDLTGQDNTLDGKVWQIFATSCGIVFPLIELTCYLVIFHDHSTHNNGNIKKLLGKECIRQRNRSNAITFLGQFCGFLIEFVFMVIFTTILVLEESNTQFKSLSKVLMFIEFGMLSMVEVLASDSLRNYFIESMYATIERMFVMIFWF